MPELLTDLCVASRFRVTLAPVIDDDDSDGAKARAAFFERVAEVGWREIEPGRRVVAFRRNVVPGDRAWQLVSNGDGFLGNVQIDMLAKQGPAGAFEVRVVLVDATIAGYEPFDVLDAAADGFVYETLLVAFRHTAVLRSEDLEPDPA